MKTPDEAGYPTGKNLLEASKNKLEEGIERGIFTFKSSEIQTSKELETWLAQYNWKLVYYGGSSRDGDPSYWKLEPLNK